MGCSQGGADVVWSDIHALAASIDALAAAKSIPNWTDLTDGCSPPFYLSTVVPFSGYLQVNLTTSATHYTVASNRLVSDFDVPWTSGDAHKDECLSLVAGDAEQECFLVDTQETCWCTTHTKVEGQVGSTAGLTDTQAVDRGCCPKLCVPMPGMKLAKKKSEREANPDEWDCWGEDFVPVQKLTMIERTFGGGVPDASDPEVRFFNVKPCDKAATGDVVVRMRKTRGRWAIDAILRKMSGYFTWRIAKKQFSTLITALETIVRESCGSSSAGVVAYAGYGCAPRTSEGCPIELIDILYTMAQCNGDDTFACPGAIAVEGSTGGCGSADAQYPWDGATNGAEVVCAGQSPLYRTVVDQLSAIISRTADWIKPRQAGGCNCPDCSICFEAGAGFKGSCAELYGKSTTPVARELTIGISVGCYDYSALGAADCASADSFGLNQTQTSSHYKQCTASLELSCRSKPECAGSPCKGCNLGDAVAHPEDFFGWKIYPNSCQEDGPALGSGITFTYDFSQDCCRGMFECACSSNDSEFPA